MSQMRKEYRPLSDEEKANIVNVKDLAEQLYSKIDALSNEKPSRELDIAKEKVEECVMWATKSITQ